MKHKDVSKNLNIYISLEVVTIIMTVIFELFIYHLTKNIAIVCLMLVLPLLFSVAFLLLLLYLRNEIILFGNTICLKLDEMLSGTVQTKTQLDEESYFSIIDHRLNRLYDIMQEHRRGISLEKDELQQLISDISHQVKTPVANLKMATDALLEKELPYERQIEFLEIMDGQIDKLSFLIQALIKTSRLETGVFDLKKEKSPICETIASALSDIYLQSKKKKIEITVDCSDDINVYHDKKWTGEAFYNLLDNAVKYTAEHGCVFITVQKFELYTKIDIKDNGRGINESHITDIFKRFYREPDVYNTVGFGIGLYLVRKIITLQGGYLLVSSELGKGTTFSIFLLNKRL